MKFVACVNKIACMTTKFFIFSQKEVKCFIDFLFIQQRSFFLLVQVLNNRHVAYTSVKSTKFCNYTCFLQLLIISNFE